MKKLTTLLFSLMLILGMVGSSGATNFTLDTINVSLNTSDPGLVLYWQQNLSTPFNFQLVNAGDSVSANFFRIGTNEGTINLGEDTVSKNITATFNFSDPSVSAADTGQTFGIWLVDIGVVNWFDPVYFNFGNTGKFSINLSNEIFGTPGWADICGKITLICPDVAPVPEPSTVLLLGGGLLGLGFYGRRKIKTV